MSAPTRRALLAGGYSWDTPDTVSGRLLGEPLDAELLAAIGAFSTAHSELRRVVASGKCHQSITSESEAQEQAVADHNDLVDNAFAEVVAAPAKSLSGLAAKGRFLLNVPDELPGEMRLDLAEAIARDAVALSGGRA